MVDMPTVVAAGKLVLRSALRAIDNAGTEILVSAHGLTTGSGSVKALVTKQPTASLGECGVR